MQSRTRLSLIVTTAVCSVSLFSIIAITFGKSTATYIAIATIGAIFGIFVAIIYRRHGDWLGISVKIAAYGLTLISLLIAAVEFFGSLLIYNPSLAKYPYARMFSGPALSLATSWCIWRYFRDSDTPQGPSFLRGPL